MSISAWGPPASRFLNSKARSHPWQHTVRNASLTSAINRGKRRSRDPGSYNRPRDGNKLVIKYHGAKGETWPERVRSVHAEDQSDSSPLDSGDRPSVSDRRELASNSSTPGKFMGLPSTFRSETRMGDTSRGRYSREDRKTNRQRNAASKAHVKTPASVPYTTPASEFIYGTSAIRSALRCNRRKLYKLYIYDGMENQSGDSRDESLAKLALLNGVQVKNVVGDWIRLLDKMSSGRPHNGYVLEASPLPKMPILSYEPVESPTAGNFTVNIGHQSQEEEDINGTNNLIPSLGTFTSPPAGSPTKHRYPFTLLLDGILDPGNLGAIIRSAYYLGVDAITFAARNSAPFSPVTIKSSAGAAENIPLLSVINTVQFVDTSRSNGWRFFAAEAPGSTSSKRDRGQSSRDFGFPTHASLSELSQALTETPCVLMLGGEGAGLSSNLRKRADTFIGIPGARMDGLHGDAAGVDSLNVSVASALLCDAFLRAPVDNSTTPLSESTEGGVVEDEVDKQASSGNEPGAGSISYSQDEERLF
ncbi:hypothetical protein FQN54_000495 [Arachnomyces sp. PD_36]|nr:hypothetical protein FQN54_000495 [Arachnomyces sp. PD_36]